MEKPVGRKAAVTARNRIEHAIFHLKQAGHSAELDAGLTAVMSAFDHIREATLDVCYASTGAEYDPDSPGNVRVGITAHCACGRVFADDVHACAPAPRSGPNTSDLIDRVVARLNAGVQFYNNAGAPDNLNVSADIRTALELEFKPR